MLDTSLPPETTLHWPALVLNADYRPLNWHPLSVWSWQDAVKAVFQGRVQAVAEYDQRIRSPSFSLRLPSVVVLKDFVRPRKRVAFTRFNLFLRDGFCCQYCGARGELTFDHVVPRSRGGVTSWQNVVAACAPCNLHKANRSLRASGLSLARAPVEPTAEFLNGQGRKIAPGWLHESWRDFLYWDAELEA